jgi:hypothetical protein
MPAATLADMPRKPKKRPAGEPPPKGTAAVRVEADLVRMLNVICAVTGEFASDILSPLVRSHVERRYKEVVRQLGKEVEEGER